MPNTPHHPGDELPPPAVRIRDLAAELGVSEVTISLALRNHPRISVARRAQVQAYAAKRGYRPNAMATALAHRKWSGVRVPIHAAIAWINFWPNPNELRKYKEFDLYWQGAQSEAERCGYRLEELACCREMDTGRLEKILLARNIRGILLPPVPPGMVPEWGDFHWEKFCAVRFGYSMEVPRVHVVTSDQLTDGILAFKSMWERGYRRIGLVTTTKSRTRFSAGYLMGKFKRQPDLQLEPAVLDTDRLDLSEHRLREWFAANRPDAILTDDGRILDLLAALSLQVPRDVAVAALSVLDGHADAGIDQNSRETGRAAVQLVISLMHHDETGIPNICREVLIEGEWVDGNTLPIKTPAARRPSSRRRAK